MAIRWDNTHRTMMLASKIKFVDEPKQPDEVLKFKVGDIVTTTESSTVKPGIKLEVKMAEIIDGFAKYYAGGMWHRQQDLQ